MGIAEPKGTQVLLRSRVGPGSPAGRQGSGMIPGRNDPPVGLFRVIQEETGTGRGLTDADRRIQCLGGSHRVLAQGYPTPLCRVGLANPGHPIRVLQPPPSMGLPNGSLTNLSPAERPQGEGTECTRPPASLPHLGTSEDILCVGQEGTTPVSQCLALSSLLTLSHSASIY